MANKDNLFFQTNPLGQAVVTAATKVDPFSKKEIKGGTIIILLKELGLSTPEAQTVVSLISPKAGDKKLTPERRVNLILRYFGLPRTEKNLNAATSIAAKAGR